MRQRLSRQAVVNHLHRRERAEVPRRRVTEVVVERGQRAVERAAEVRGGAGDDPAFVEVDEVDVGRVVGHRLLVAVDTTDDARRVRAPEHWRGGLLELHRDDVVVQRELGQARRGRHGRWSSITRLARQRNAAQRARAPRNERSCPIKQHATRVVRSSVKTTEFKPMALDMAEVASTGASAKTCLTSPVQEPCHDHAGTTRKAAVAERTTLCVPTSSAPSMATQIAR